MSQHYKTDEERRGMRVVCEFCEAQPGEWCRSHLQPGRLPAKRMHRVRFELADYHRRDRLAILLELAQNDPHVARVIADAGLA